MNTISAESSKASTSDLAGSQAENDEDTRTSISEDACNDGEALTDDYNGYLPGRSRYGRIIKPTRPTMSIAMDSPQVQAVYS